MWKYECLSTFTVVGHVPLSLSLSLSHTHTHVHTSMQKQTHTVPYTHTHRHNNVNLKFISLSISVMKMDNSGMHTSIYITRAQTSMLFLLILPCSVFICTWHHDKHKTTEGSFTNRSRCGVACCFIHSTETNLAWSMNFTAHACCVHLRKMQIRTNKLHSSVIYTLS